MARIDAAVFNSGPFIHLAQIGFFRFTDLFKCILVPQEVYREITFKDSLGSREIKSIRNVYVKDLNPRYKDFSKMVAFEYGLDTGESQCIALGKQENVRLFMTDDLDARVIGKALGFNVHGTIGIILRAYREGIISGEEALEMVKNLKNKSSLFITSDIVNFVTRKIREYH